MFVYKIIFSVTVDIILIPRPLSGTLLAGEKNQEDIVSGVRVIEILPKNGRSLLYIIRSHDFLSGKILNSLGFVYGCASLEIKMVIKSGNSLF